MKLFAILILASTPFLAQAAEPVIGSLLQNRSELADFKVTVDLPAELREIKAGQASVDLGTWRLIMAEPFSSCSLEFSARNHTRTFEKTQFSIAEAVYSPPRSNKSDEEMREFLVKELGARPEYVGAMKGREDLMGAILTLGGRIDTSPKIHVLFAPVTANSSFQLVCEAKAHYTSLGEFVEDLKLSEIGKFIQIEAKF
ncbi:MAG: hypothetical protein ACK5Y2_08840 [Bdellovibrionales bacterium]